MVSCFTCGTRGFWKKNGIECGHYIGRGNYGTRWMGLNCRPQCHECNVHRGGNLEIYTQRLIDEHGEKIIQYLTTESLRVKKLNREDVRALRLKFEKEAAQIRKEKNL